MQKIYSQEEVVKMLEAHKGDRSQNALASEMGISPAYLSDILCGHRSPGPKVLAFFGLEIAFVESKRAA